MGIDDIIENVITEESVQVEVVSTDDAPTTIEIKETGPPGPRGDIGDLGDGAVDGDLLRWNASTGAWEVRSEPFEFKQITLTPAEEATLNREGGVWYRSTDKSIYVCTEGE